jgi:hypothetical protein
MRPSLSPVV